MHFGTNEISSETIAMLQFTYNSIRKGHENVWTF